jgi:hypothetical protein
LIEALERGVVQIALLRCHDEESYSLVENEEMVVVKG